MDEIRKALGEDKISYFGFSYGSELGATYATMFPTPVRAMVVDGAVDPNSDVRRRGPPPGRRAGARRSSSSWPTARPGPRCAFHNGGNPGAALDALLAKLDANPLAVPSGREIGQGIAYNAVISGPVRQEQSGPTWPRRWPTRQNGRRLELLARSTTPTPSATPDGTYSNAFEGLIAINCLDDPGPDRPGLRRPARRRVRRARPTPRAGRARTATSASFWPVPQQAADQDHRRRRRPDRGGRHDGRPDHADREHQAPGRRARGRRLVTVVGERHTGYMLNGCSTQAVDDYLVDLKIPKEGLVCA